jgi:hypothetical protein
MMIEEFVQGCGAQVCIFLQNRKSGSLVAVDNPFFLCDGTEPLLQATLQQFINRQSSIFN